MHSNQITLKQYRVIDITIFAIVLCLFEFLSVFILNIDEYPYFSLSISLPIILICMMRWNHRCFILPILSGVVFCLTIGNATVENYVIYSVGNLFILFNLIWFKLPKEKITQSSLLTILYTVSGYVLMCLGRSVVSIFFDKNFLDVFIAFLGTGFINLVLASFIVLIARIQPGMFKDQITYLKEVQEEQMNDTEIITEGEKNEI